MLLKHRYKQVLAKVTFGCDIFIPRIPLIIAEVPIQFKRLQCTISLGFANVYDKFQGQKLTVV